MPYKFQRVWPEYASCYRYAPDDRIPAKVIAFELPRILVDLDRVWRELQQVPLGLEPDPVLLERMEDVLIGAGDALKLGDPWEAYLRWREFVDEATENGYSIADWCGDLIIERPGKDKFYFYPKPPKKKEGPSLEGSRWKILRGDAFQETHPFVTVSEESAKKRTAAMMRDWTIEALKNQVGLWALIGPRQKNEHAEFVKDGRQLITELESDLDAGFVWRAYHRLKEFEKKYDGEFEGFPIQSTIGRLEVTPEPEPE